MPRSLSTALQTQVSATSTKQAFLVELNLSTVIRLTDFYTNVTYNSETYEAGGSFLTVDATTETGAFTDKTVEVYLAYFDANDSIVGAISYFTGNIRNVSIEETINNSTMQLTIASHWSNWNLTKGRHYSDESQQDFSSGDRGFEFATQVKNDVRWGS